MRAGLPFHECSMSAIALEARALVRDAACPVMPGETVKAQMRRAWDNLGRWHWWRVRAAWNGEAGCWSAAAFEELRRRHHAWRVTYNSRVAAADVLAADRAIAQAAALERIDAEFHAVTIGKLRALADEYRRRSELVVREEEARALTREIAGGRQ